MKIFLVTFTLIFSTVQGIKAQIPTDSLVIEYMFNNNSNDGSGNGFHATVNGASLTNDRFGLPDRAYYFDGTNDYIEIPNDPELKPDFPFSVSVWFKIDGISGNAAELYVSDAISGVYSGFWAGYRISTMELGAGYGDGLGVGAGNRFSKRATQPIDTTSWHHFLVVFNALGDIDLYIDCDQDPGVYSGSGGAMGDLGNSGRIGKWYVNSGNNYHNGKIDDIRLYNRALTTLEIISLCQENDPTQAINETELYQGLNIFPNPSSDHINIEFEDDKWTDGGEIRIMNVMGQSVYGTSVLNQKMRIDRSMIGSNGLYIVQLLNTSEQVLRSHKIMLN